jgi:phosphoribosylanthranilate isomerase
MRINTATPAVASFMQPYSALQNTTNASETITTSVEDLFKDAFVSGYREKALSYLEHIDVNYDHGYFLIKAAQRGDTDILKRLLDRGANAGLTKALLAAACDGNKACVELLIGAGADPSVLKDTDAYTAYPGMQALVEALKECSATGKPAEKDTQGPLSDGHLLEHDLPASLGERYVKRQADFAQIDHLLATRPYVIISGEKGLGKTTLAVEYGHHKRQETDGATLVVIMAANTPKHIEETYQQMAAKLGVIVEEMEYEEVIQAVHREIHNQQKNLLLILDGVESYQDIIYLNYLPDPIKAVVTTRHRLKEGKLVINLAPFTPVEAEQFIALSVLGGYLQRQEAQALAQYYSKDTASILPGYVDKAIKALTNLRALSQAYANEEGLRLQQALMAKSTFAWPLLQYAAYLDADFIDLNLFKRLLKVDQEQLDKAVNTLTSALMLTKVAKAGQTGLSLPQVMQRIMREVIEYPAYPSCGLAKLTIIAELAQILNKLCPTVEEDPTQWRQAKGWMPHIEAVLSHLSDALIDPIAASLWAKKGNYADHVLVQYNKALIAHQKALAIWQKLYPDQPHPKVAASLNNVGTSYHQLGGQENRMKALQLQERALRMEQALYLDQPHPSIATSLSNLGINYQQLDGLEKNTIKALQLQEQALVMRQALYPDQPHSDVADSLNNLGWTYRQLDGQENRKKALQLQEQALAMYQALYPDQLHLRVATCLNNVGQNYQELGGQENRKKALQLQEQALAMYQAVYPDQPHPDVATCLNNVGKNYQELGGQENTIKSLQLLEQALVMRQALYPDQPHPNVAVSLNNMGVGYVQLGGQENAIKGLQLLERALVMRQAVYLDQPHPDVANSLNNVGCTYRQLDGQENRKKALQLQEQALAMYQALYPDQPHPNVAQSLKNIGNLLMLLGQVEKGQRYLQQAAEMQDKLNNH